MIKKRISGFIVCISILGTLLSGCASQSKQLSYKEVKPLKELSTIYSKRMPIDEKIALEKTNHIVKGTVIDRKEISIDTSSYDGYPQEIFKTLIDLKVENVYFSTEKKVKNSEVITILYNSTSRQWNAEAISMEKNNSYILLLSDVIPHDDDPTKIHEIVKYAIIDETSLIISEKDAEFEYHKIFTSLDSKEAKSKFDVINNNNEKFEYLKDIKIRTDKENFIRDIQNLASKKGGLK